MRKRMNDHTRVTIDAAPRAESSGANQFSPKRFRVARASGVLAVAVLALSACVDEPVNWVDGMEMAEQHPSPLAFPGRTPFDSVISDTAAAAQFARTQDLLGEAGATSVLDAALAAMPAGDTSSVADASFEKTPAGMQHVMPMAGHEQMNIPGDDLGAGEFPVDPARCARSLRIAESPGRGTVAVWWSRRDRGRVFLVAAWKWNGMHSDSAVVWRGPVNVDTLDQGAGDANALERGAVGCDRAAPGVAIGDNGYVHVAFALNAPEGPGIFYAHQMDPRSQFEPPVVMMYGDRRLGAARVAASGTTVAVVFEDPNAPLNRGRIGLALSKTSGHTFEPRVTASRSGRAADPFVALRARSAVVGWTDTDSTVSATSAFRMRRATLR